jgi:hypothetical protein
LKSSNFSPPAKISAFAAAFIADLMERFSQAIAQSDFAIG